MRIIGLAGWSGSGKTTLLAKIIPRLIARGLMVSTVKHAHHGFDVDQPGKDSHTHRMAGATEVLVASGRRWALMHELRGAAEPTIYDLLQRMSPVDLVLIEGFKSALHARIEVFRKEVGKPPFHPENPHVVGIVSDTPFPDAGRPVVDIDDVEAVVVLVLAKAEPLDVVLARARMPSRAPFPAASGGGLRGAQTVERRESAAAGNGDTAGAGGAGGTGGA
jgi:molybdopterin-guanine dinucleotide biosynthesis adapter protein